MIISDGRYNVIEGSARPSEKRIRFKVAYWKGLVWLFSWIKRLITIMQYRYILHWYGVAPVLNISLAFFLTLILHWLGSFVEHFNFVGELELAEGAMFGIWAINQVSVTYLYLWNFIKVFLFVWKTFPYLSLITFQSNCKSLRY